MKETDLFDIFGSLNPKKSERIFGNLKTSEDRQGFLIRKRTGQDFKDEVRKGWKEKEDVKKTKVGDIFGILKGKIKKPTQQIMDEVNEELWLI
jgi:hypothetical protein